MFNRTIEAFVSYLSPQELAGDLAFATSNVDLEERAACEWVACELIRHIGLLPGNPPSGEGSSPAGLLEEIKAALEGDSNDAEHDALVSVAERLGLTWTAPDA
jgi:hypothetical protein